MVKNTQYMPKIIFRIFTSLILMAYFAASCTEWNATSEQVVKEVETPDTITKVSITKNSNFLRFQVHLIPDTIHAFFLEGDTKSVNGVVAETDGRMLVLEDENAWRLAEGFHNTLHFKWHIPPGTSFNLRVDGTPINISSADTLRNPSLAISSSKSFGTINLLVANNRCAISQSSGSADFTVKGRTQKLSVTCNGSGPMFMDKLVADAVSVATEGQNDVYIHCKKQLKATINNIGNVYYAGNPGEITEKGDGPGKLIAITKGD